MTLKVKRTLAVILGNKFYKQINDRAFAFTKAWAIANDDRPLGSCVIGVSDGKRQIALERLQGYEPEKICVTLETGDDAIKVLVNIENRKKYHLGDLPPKMASLLRLMAQKGFEAQATFAGVIDGYEEHAERGAYIGIKL